MPDLPSSALEFQEDTSAYPTVFKPHDYGVTAILPLQLPGEFSNMPPLLLTGGYDDHVKLHGPEGFPKSTTARLKVLSELNLGGGVWKLKLVNHEFSHEGGIAARYQILASCVSGTLNMEY